MNLYNFFHFINSIEFENNLNPQQIYLTIAFQMNESIPVFQTSFFNVTHQEEKNDHLQTVKKKRIYLKMITGNFHMIKYCLYLILQCQ